MSVTILPYIDDSYKTNRNSGAQAGQTSPTADTNPVLFREVLDATKRANSAMAVDAMIAKSRCGKVSGDTIQKMLGFRPQAAASVSSSMDDNSSSVSGTQSAAASGKDSGASASRTSGAAATATASTGSVSGCPASLEDDFETAAATYHVDINLLKAVAKAESGFNPSATSSAGAMGVMQLMPSTAKGLGITNAYNAHDNIMGGAKILSQNLSRYKGDVSLALAGYNAGCGNVDKYGGIPPFKETQNYVKKVLGYYQKAQG